ncbi:MAG: 30S ribosomal protein S15 [Candidatus Micrarchaeia archaeon]|jgi:small subunit ribosomal protein S15
MAKLHSRKRGRSGSKRPALKVAPEWVEYSAHEIEDLVVKLAKQGNDATTIGRILRDQYGVPQVRTICNKKISQILEENSIKVNYPDDLLALIKRAVRMIVHLEKNKGDGTNTTKLLHVESKIKRLADYYIKKKKLPVSWKYDRERAALIVK